ncbi:hypothetical protein GCM10009681_36650 [Luedemannella helvata]|uniref:Secreted protein n=1 Tax=Luedemannella helvata TaxID=349315 RepID=A0ABP4WWG3_9ACTN
MIVVGAAATATGPACAGIAAPSTTRAPAAKAATPFLSVTRVFSFIRAVRVWWGGPRGAGPRGLASRSMILDRKVR